MILLDAIRIALQLMFYFRRATADDETVLANSRDRRSLFWRFFLFFFTFECFSWMRRVCRLLSNSASRGVSTSNEVFFCPLLVVSIICSITWPPRCAFSAFVGSFRGPVLQQHHPPPPRYWHYPPPPAIGIIPRSKTPRVCTNDKGGVTSKGVPQVRQSVQRANHAQGPQAGARSAGTSRQWSRQCRSSANS